MSGTPGTEMGPGGQLGRWVGGGDTGVFEPNPVAPTTAALPSPATSTTPGFDPITGLPTDPTAIAGAPTVGQNTAAIAGIMPTTADEALRANQIQLVQQQQGIASEMLRRQNLLEPTLLGQAGFEQVLGPNGEVVGYRPSAATSSTQAQNDQIASMMRTRTLAALRGELPVDPALERELSQGRTTLQQTLLHQLGSGAETSTPGIEALANFDKRAAELRQASRMDQLRGGETTRLAGQAGTSVTSQNTLNDLLNLFKSNQNAANIFSTAGQGLVNPAQVGVANRQLFGNVISNQAQQGTALEAAKINAAASTRNAQLGANAATSAAESAGMGSLFGSVLGNLPAIGGAIGGIADILGAGAFLL